MMKRSNISNSATYIKSLNTRILKPWTEEENTLILIYSKQKYSPDDISKKLNRPISDIRSKLKAIAAHLYFKDNLPYEKVQELTGVEKNTVVLTASTVKKQGISIQPDIENNVVLDVSIYEFPEKPEEIKPISYNNCRNTNEPLVIVSLESPFSIKSIYEHISTPILNTFTTCSNFAMQLSNVN
jgi:hypothetical protein